MGNQKERRRRKMERKEIHGVTIVMLSIREIVLSVDLSPTSPKRTTSKRHLPITMVTVVLATTTVIRCDLWKGNYLAICVDQRNLLSIQRHNSGKLLSILIYSYCSIHSKKSHIPNYRIRRDKIAKKNSSSVVSGSRNYEEVMGSRHKL